MSPDRDGLSVLSCTRFPMNRAEPIDHPPVDRRLWWRFVAMARPYWSGAERTRAIGLLAICVFICNTASARCFLCYNAIMTGPDRETHE